MWTYLDDKYPDHPRIAPLSDAGFRLHTTGIVYSNRLGTDGRIPKDDVPRLVRRYRRSALQELLDARLWRDCGTHYEIRDWVQWNKPSDERKAAREALSRKRSEAGRKGAAARWGKA